LNPDFGRSQGFLFGLCLQVGFEKETQLMHPQVQRPYFNEEIETINRPFGLIVYIYNMNTRERLISITSDLIRKKGYFGTGINEILKQVAVPKGSLYHHFPNGKDELIREAVYYGGESQMHKYGNALRGKPAEEGLAAMIDVMVEELTASNFEDACPIAAVAMASGSIDDDIRAACAKVFVGWQNDLAGYLERRGVDNAQQKAEELYAMFEGAYVLSKAHKDVKYLLLQKKFIAVILNS
tara:strand:- start:40369 stop:41085 length:717 start_codon:yes stop_codon:yes gene_type:complete